MEKLTIKSWALDDRPREKLVAKGKLALSDAELIAILIGSGNREESAVGLSKRILQSVDGNINRLAKLSVEKLTEFKGIGAAKAVAIITALELGKRRQLEIAQEKPKITSSKDVFNLMQPIIGDLEHEEFWVLFLNNSNKVLSKSQISKGGLTATIVDVRLLFKRALELASVGVIVCHNHPSGKLEPSNADKQITQKIKLAGVTLDIKLLDHLIVTQKAYFSFADEGIM
ncbi:MULTISPECIES: RadC family protein [unclassified Polaribacter]|uniref:RadC family protein n=1 Tax=unclassified Polaribacter TaxID=196858 RepID=UPI0011BE7531|nr:MULTISPECIES: DNA repair protein RadC [unclassified Polaribacter]TXD54282.1 JAB domain-containing protein [Polaribacter sp. IC063]TXD62887.1 JAB domain-containing protein [Polaribacter sp. IC066]